MSDLLGIHICNIRGLISQEEFRQTLLLREIEEKKQALEYIMRLLSESEETAKDLRAWLSEVEARKASLE